MGWRLPFLFGLIIGPVGLYIRRYLEETEAFIESRRAVPATDRYGRSSRRTGADWPSLSAWSSAHHFVLRRAGLHADIREDPARYAADGRFRGTGDRLLCLTVAIPLCGALSTGSAASPS